MLVDTSVDLGSDCCFMAVIRNGNWARHSLYTELGLFETDGQRLCGTKNSQKSPVRPLTGSHSTELHP